MAHPVAIRNSGSMRAKGTPLSAKEHGRGSSSAASPPTSDGPLAATELALMNAYWRAANYLSVGMIFLRYNPLLREPLTVDLIKHRLLGHWGTSPALSFVWVHLNRVIVKYGFAGRVLLGPKGGPGTVTLGVSVRVAGAQQNTLATDKMSVTTTIPPDSPAGYFSMVREIAVPIVVGTRPEDYKVFVAFDRNVAGAG